MSDRDPLDDLVSDHQEQLRAHRKSAKKAAKMGWSGWEQFHTGKADHLQVLVDRLVEAQAYRRRPQ